MTLDGPVLIQHPNDPCQWILFQEYMGIPKGFVTDFASIPRCFWNIVSPTELGDTGPIVHDWMYRQGLGSRALADAIFLTHMEDDGIAYWKRYACYWLVRAWGWKSWASGDFTIVEID